MYRTFTRGIIAGTILGMTLGIMFPTKNVMKMGRRVFRNGKGIVRRAGSMLDNMIDI